MKTPNEKLQDVMREAIDTIDKLSFEQAQYILDLLAEFKEMKTSRAATKQDLDAIIKEAFAEFASVNFANLYPKNRNNKDG